MNRAIARLFLLTILLFGLLIAFTSRWTVFEAGALRDNAKNQRATLRGQFVDRGRILAADGTVLARSIRRRDETYTRRYPEPTPFPHAVGYSYTRIGQAGLERAYDDELAGRTGQLGTILDRLQDEGGPPRGSDVRTALDPGAQRAANAALAGRKGAIVALDPRNGQVKVMASSSMYDPNELRRAGALARLNRDEANAPLVNRATQAGYPPGSTFKVVTAIAAIDSGRFEPSSIVDGRNGKTVSGRPLQNFGGADFGQITLTTALTKSVNTAWAAVGERLGGATMQRYMDRLGFGDQVPVDLPGSERGPSGNFVEGRPVPADDRRVDVGRMSIGQDKLLVTPLQMAMVAAAVANGGELMRPHLANRIIDPDSGDVAEDLRDGERLSRVMSEDSARRVGDMMAAVVEEGSGTAAALEGISVAGKTGTAEVRREGCTGDQLWFIAFAPRDRPRTAIAVTLECAVGTGGEVAAPIAKRVMQELLG